METLWHRVIWVKFSSSLSSVAVAGQRADSVVGGSRQSWVREKLSESQKGLNTGGRGSGTDFISTLGHIVYSQRVFTAVELPPVGFW